MVWLTVGGEKDNTSFLLSEQTETSIPIETGGDFPNDFCRAEFYVSTMTNYTVQFTPILSEGLQEQYGVGKWIFNATIKPPSSKLASIPRLYHYYVEIELIRPSWFKNRWYALTWFPIAIIAILIAVSNSLIPAEDRLQAHITIFVSIVFFSLGFISSVVQFLPSTFLEIEYILPIEVAIATSMLVANMIGNMKEIDMPIFWFIWSKFKSFQVHAATEEEK